MKYLINFKKYGLIKEAEENIPSETLPETTPETAPTQPETNTTPLETPIPTDTDINDDKVEVESRNSAVVLKEFFEELRSHLIYWFKYGKITQFLSANTRDITIERRGICIWASDNDGKYMWKIKFLEAEIQGNIKRMEKVLLTMDVYSYDEDILLKSKEIVIPVDKIHEDFLIEKIKKVKSTILKVPHSIEDVKKFKNIETDLLEDDIY